MLLVFGAATCFWFMCWTPHSGTAVAALGAVAAIMTARDLTPGQRVGWVVVIFALLVVEVRAIRRDRAQDEARWNIAQQKLQTNFATVQKNLQNDFAGVLAQNQQAFDETMRHIANLAQLSTEAVNNLTGGDSYCYVDTEHLAANRITFFLTSGGSHSLYDIDGSITDTESLMDIQIPGTSSLGPGPFPHTIATLPGSGITQKRYRIMIRARNGTFHQILYLHNTGDGWTTATIVLANYSQTKQGVVLERRPQEFRALIAKDREWADFLKRKRLIVK
jgi:hypothetical protein